VKRRRRTAAIPPLRRVRWREATRILPTRYPPVPLFERLGDPATWAVLAEVEALTNPRIREEVGSIAHVPVAERVAGPGASWVMGAFAHRRPSRFSDGSHGVYYCADHEATAIAETRWHLGRFYAATLEPPLDVEMRVLVGSIDDRFHDLRRSGKWRAALHPDDYTAGQLLGRNLRELGSRGVVYPSVRHAGGQCVGAFTPRAVGLPRQAGVLRYHWNGTRIDRVFDYRAETWTEYLEDP
jgi:RES domain-containing protein